MYAAAQLKNGFEVERSGGEKEKLRFFLVYIWRPSENIYSRFMYPLPKNDGIVRVKNEFAWILNKSTS